MDFYTEKGVVLFVYKIFDSSNLMVHEHYNDAVSFKLKIKSKENVLSYCTT